VKRGRIRLYFEGEDRGAVAAAARTEAAVVGVDDATKRYNKTAGEQQVAIEKVNRRNFELVSSTKAVNRESASLVDQMQNVNLRFTSMRNIVSLIKWPALISGAGYAAEGIGALGAGATGLVGALAPLSGALAAYPALLGGVGQAAGVLALTQMDDLKSALEGNEEALKKLSPQAKGLLSVIKGLEPEFKKLRSTVQARLFDGLTTGLKSARGNFDVVRRVMGATATSLGNLARRAGELVGGKGFGRDLERIGKGNATVLERMGLAGLKLGSALRHVMVAAQPFLGWLSGSAIKLADWVNGAAEAGRESGKLHGFFNRTREVIERLSSITGSLVSGFLDIGHAAAPLGREILAALDDAAQGFSSWTSSIEGKNKLKDYFENAKPAIFEMGRLVRDVAGVFLELSASTGIAPLTRQIRTELVPVIKEVLEGTTQSFGPHLVSALVQIGKLFGHLVGSSGPLTLFVDAIGRFAGFINFLFEKVPGLNGVVVTLAGAMGVAKAMKFTAAITGVSTLIDLFKKLKTAAIGAKIAEEGASAPSFLGGGVGRSAKGGGIKGKLGGLLGLGATAATTVGPAGMLSGAEVAGMGGAEGAGGLLAAAPAAAPWLAIAAAVAATAAGLVLLYKNSKTFRDMLAPIGQAGEDAFNGIKAQLAPLGKAVSDLGKSFGGNDGLIGKAKALYQEFKGPINAVLGLLRSVWLHGIESVFDRVAQVVRGLGQIFGGWAQQLRGVIEVITGILTLKFGKAWQGVKDIFSGGIKVALGFLRIAVSPITSIVKAIGGVLSDVFGGAWEKVKGIFEDGRDAVVGFVQDVLDVVNLIPGIPDIHIEDSGPKTSSRKESKEALHHQHRYSGGPITRPTAIVGEEAPQHHEWVIATNPRYRKNNIGYWMQAGRDLGIPGFFSGGDIAGAVGGAVGAAASTLGGAVSNIVGKGSSYFLDKLPTPHLPSWMTGLGSYAIDHVADFIRNGFQSKKLGKLSIAPGVTGYTGPPANLKQLGDNRYVDSHTLAVTALLDRMFGLSMSSGYRSPQHNAEIGGAPGSFHTHGSPSNPGATDSVGPMGKMKAYIAFAKKHVVGLKEAMVDNYAGQGWNAHLGFFAKGGKVDWGKLVGSHWDNDELATLAHIVGMANPGYMAQIAQGESSGDASAHGVDPGGTEGLGLWQVTTGYNDELIAKYGGRGAMFDPLKNAEAAAEILASSGTGAWYAPPTGPKGKVNAALATKIRAAMSGKPVGGDGASTKKRDFKFGLGQHNTAVSLPGLPAGQVPAEAAGLPSQIRDLFKQPGLSFASKVGIAEYAASSAASTREPTFDAQGIETSADSHADDKAAARLQKSLAEANKRRLEKRLREIKAQLQKKGLSQKQRNRLLAEQAQLTSNLTATRQGIQGFNETLSAGPDAPEGPTAMDYASRDLALAELNHDAAGESAARQQMLQIAEGQLAAAQQTADPRDDIEAIQQLKAIREAIDNSREHLEELLALQKQQTEERQRALNVSQSQYDVLAQAIAAVVSGQIGGRVGLGFQTPSVAGSLANY